jgi:hypothetical protein
MAIECKAPGSGYIMQGSILYGDVYQCKENYGDM